MKKEIIQELNSDLKENRIFGIKKFSNLIQKSKEKFKKTDEVNNHVHSIYSFSPCSPYTIV